MSSTEPTLGLVLAGGAARGAYQAGVLRFLFEELPKNLGYVPWPDLVSGTSVGSLNGVFAAARDPHGVRALRNIWQNLRIDSVYRFGVRDVIRTLRAPMNRGDVFSLLDGTPLRNLIAGAYPSRSLRRAIDEGHTRAFLVSATELASGRNVLFVDSASPKGTFRQGPSSRLVRTRLTAEHCLASASLPFVFSPVYIDGRWLVDGGLRMNTPLAPVLRAGATRSIVVSLMKARSGLDEGPPPIPDLYLLAGKTLNSLLLDPVERDLHHVERFNNLVRWGSDRYGATFPVELAERHGIRESHALFIRPTADIGRIASEVYRSRPPQTGWASRMLLRRAHDRTHPESDLLSYLYFDREFTGVLERLGFEDARRMEAELANFVSGGPIPMPSTGGAR